MLERLAGMRPEDDVKKTARVARQGRTTVVVGPFANMDRLRPALGLTIE